MMPWSRDETVTEADTEMTQRTDFKITIIKIFLNLI